MNPNNDVNQGNRKWHHCPDVGAVNAILFAYIASFCVVWLGMSDSDTCLASMICLDSFGFVHFFVHENKKTLELAAITLREFAMLFLHPKSLRVRSNVDQTQYSYIFFRSAAYDIMEMREIKMLPGRPQFVKGLYSNLKRRHINLNIGTKFKHYQDDGTPHHQAVFRMDEILNSDLGVHINQLLFELSALRTIFAENRISSALERFCIHFF